MGVIKSFHRKVKGHLNRSKDTGVEVRRCEKGGGCQGGCIYQFSVFMSMAEEERTSTTFDSKHRSAIDNMVHTSYLHT
ncbi:hypothetical protein HanLR1_Chr09g0319811 [Helianthus annuus]|nr:hypothetical protein HanLR1_Chr09g0319811 [Helianthus annuus]